MNDSSRRIDGLDGYIDVAADSAPTVVWRLGVLRQLILGGLPARSGVGRPHDFLVAAGQNGLRVRRVRFSSVISRPQLRLTLSNGTGRQGRG